jgi:subtilisin family serine protease
MMVPGLARAQAVAPGAHFKPLARPTRFAGPLALRQSTRVKVVVRMSATAVAEARALTADHKISKTQHDGIREQVAQQQASVEPALIARGARVLAHYHDALNGVKVEIDSDQIAGLASLPGVVEVLGVRSYHLDNALSVPFIGAPQVWQATPGFRGEGVKVAIVDSGIDYTHANFGGPGTVEAYNQALATDAAAANPKWFGPNAPKVKGGIDLVGDDYDSANPDATPQPDANPLDCNGHGSHTAGTAAGFGVANDGTRYIGPYDSAAYAGKFRIGPGVAPRASLYAVRVFGCNGSASTDVIVDAIDWAIHNDMDVISMSLGSDMGVARDADAVASSNAVRAGVVVVASTGNAGPAPYLTSTPGVSSAAISVAAIDSHLTYPGERVALPSGGIQAQDSNGVPLNTTLRVYPLLNPDGTLSLGCDEGEYQDAQIAGKLVVTLRGICPREDRATYGARHGAAAVAMINNDPGYPPYEGNSVELSIPFLGVLPSDRDALLAAANTSVVLTANEFANPAYRQAAAFSSGGPRFGDSLLKPNVSAPGAAIVSTSFGTGNEGLTESGSSMAAPHVAGVAALATQAHPGWNASALSAAVVETADPGQLRDYTPSIEGAGLVQAVGATRTQAVVIAEGKGGEHAISFGFDESDSNFRLDRDLTIYNNGSTPIVFNVTSTKSGGVAHTLRLSDRSLYIRPHGAADLTVTLNVPVATVGATHDSEGNVSFAEVAGYLTFTPASSSMNGGVSLHVPYYFVPRARSQVMAQLAGAFGSKHPGANVLLANRGGGLAGNGDFYAWGLSSKRQGIAYFDTRAVGVQALPLSPNDSLLVFAINTFDRFSTASLGEFDVLIDVDGDGKPDFDLSGIDLGWFESRAATGEYVALVIDMHTGSVVAGYTADTPTDGSTVLLRVRASDLGLTPGKPRFSYTEETFNIGDGTSAAMPGSASFNAFSPALSVPGLWVYPGFVMPVAPNTRASVPVVIDPKEWGKTPALGVMVVVEDNTSGSAQAELISVGK